MVRRESTGCSAQEIRERFVAFFERYGHKKVASSPLVPRDDPSILFANAGMNQFKDYFTGRAVPEYRRAVTIQKCVRAGGKHNDLENVGFTARHHTFFEMLGNFSFGDYFKKEAIGYAWSFLTEELGLSKEKLYITVHDSDEEARQIWLRQGVVNSRIFSLGDEGNFWEMGETGPCGPCSEIFYDYGESYGEQGRTFVCPLDDGQRYVEIWNLVFMQYEKFNTEKGIQRRNLPVACVDTGAGLERIAAVLQGRYWNYDTDLFLPIIGNLEGLTGRDYGDENDASSFRIVADHARCAVMLITDGVVPSNEGQGYVLRRIIRRAVRHLKNLQAPPGALSHLVPSVFQILGDEYPQNKQGLATAEKFLESEEKNFLETLDSGMKFLDERLSDSLSEGVLAGKVLFKLYDTFGFPPDLTESILRENGFRADKEGFGRLMEERKSKSRKSWKNVGIQDNRRFHFAREKYGETVFLGYNTLVARSELLDVFELENGIKGLLFKETPFYAESGGQRGDRGRILKDGREICQIDDVKKPVDGVFIHFTETSCLNKGEKYDLEVDSQLRALTAKNHSATHLLQAALRVVLGAHVRQAGSGVDDKKLRFDFTHPKALTSDEMERIGKFVNTYICQGLGVSVKEMSMNDAMEKGAIAFFGDKYGDVVRVLQMGDISIELCGGTHVSNTSEIGIFTLTTESALGAGVRRLEAVTGQEALDRLVERSHLLGCLEAAFKEKGARLVNKIEALQKGFKEKEREIKKLNSKMGHEKAGRLFSQVEMIGDVGFIAKEAQEGDSLKELSDIFVSKIEKGIVVLYCRREEGIGVLLRSTKALRVHCVKIFKQSLEGIEGKGGGRPDMVQGQIAVDSLDIFIQRVKECLLAETQ